MISIDKKYCSPAYFQQAQQIIAKLEDVNQSEMEVYTSGSTGRPQKIRLQKEHLQASARATLEALNIPAGARVHLALPLDKIAGLMMLQRALIGGWELVLEDPKSTVLKDIPGSFDFTALVPTQVATSLPYLARVKRILIGGAPIDAKLEVDLLAKGLKAWHSYGMTETITHVALRAIDGQTHFFEALPGVHFSVNENSCLQIHAPQIGCPALQTKDVVDLLDEKRFIWKGRLDNVVISGGLKLYPEELEKKINLARPFFLSGVPDAHWGSKLVMVVEGEEFLSPEDLQQAFVNLKSVEKPKQVLYRSQFVYTSNGKLQRARSLEL